MAGLVLRAGADFNLSKFSTWLLSLDEIGPKWRPRYLRLLNDPPTTGTNKISTFICSCSIPFSWSSPRAPEVMIAWSAVDLARKIHAAASLRANGADDGAVARELRLWGDSTGPILSAARRLGVAASAEAFRVAVDGDRGLKTGLSPDPERALVGLCVLLATRFGDN